MWPDGAGGPRDGAEITGRNCSDLQLGDLCMSVWIFQQSCCDVGGGVRVDS